MSSPIDFMTSWRSCAAGPASWGVDATDRHGRCPCPSHGRDEIPLPGSALALPLYATLHTRPVAKDRFWYPGAPAVSMVSFLSAGSRGAGEKGDAVVLHVHLRFLLVAAENAPRTHGETGGFTTVMLLWGKSRHRCQPGPARCRTALGLIFATHLRYRIAAVDRLALLPKPHVGCANAREETS